GAPSARRSGGDRCDGDSKCGRGVTQASARFFPARGPSAVVDGWSEEGYACEMDYKQLITIEPGKRSGQPCIRGMRIAVQDVLEYLAGGMTVEEVLADFPELTAEDLQACLAFAADRERRLRA